MRAMSSAEGGARIIDTCQEVSVAKVGEDIGKGCGIVGDCGYSIVRDLA